MHKTLDSFVEIFSIFIMVVPLTWLIYWLFKTYPGNKHDDMQRAFKYGIKHTDSSKGSISGRFTLLEFCLEAEVDAKKAKRFLKKQVNDFGGLVDVDQHGESIYYFADAKVKFLEANLDS